MATHNEILEGNFVVVNEHESDIPIFIEIQEGIKSTENKTLPPVHQWLKVEDESFILPARGSRKVNFKVIVPTGTAGTFSGRISFVDKSHSAYSTAITVPVYVIVKGTEIVDWSVEELIIKNTPIGLSGSFVIENRGNVIFYALGRFTIKDRKQKEIFCLENAGGRNAVFPNDKVVIPLNVKNLSLKTGRYIAEINMPGYDGAIKNFKFEIVKTKDEKYQIKKLKK